MIDRLEIMEFSREVSLAPEVVEYIFDEQAGMGKNCIALYEELKGNPDKFPFPPELRAIAGLITETAGVGMPPIKLIRPRSHAVVNLVSSQVGIAIWNPDQSYIDRQ